MSKSSGIHLLFTVLIASSSGLWHAERWAITLVAAFNFGGSRAGLNQQCCSSSLRLSNSGWKIEYLDPPKMDHIYVVISSLDFKLGGLLSLNQESFVAALTGRGHSCSLAQP